MKNKCLFISLQGLGNTILNIPIIYEYSKNKVIDIIVSDNLQKSLFNNLDFINKVFTPKEFIMQQLFFKYDMSIALAPNWKRENLFLFLSRAKFKLSLINKNYPYYYKQLYILNILNKNYLIDFNLHDTENNMKLLNIHKFSYIQEELEKSLLKTVNANNLPYELLQNIGLW